jgi:hypothetical protein
MDADLYQYIEALVRAVVEETFAELDDAEAFLAIPPTEPQPTLTVATIRTMRAQLLGDLYNGRWEDLSYSDHVFLYEMGISLDNPDGGLL